MYKTYAAVASLAIAVSFYLFNATISDRFISSIGEIKTITLADQSTVTLNSNTVLTFKTKRFFNSDRMITLEGEAFFNVKKDMNNPFKIRTHDAITTVLGTTFNLNSRHDKTILVVKSGKVSFKSLTKSLKLLEKNQSTSSHSDSIIYGLNSKFDYLSKTISFKSKVLVDVLEELKGARKFKTIRKIVEDSKVKTFEDI